MFWGIFSMLFTSPVQGRHTEEARMTSPSCRGAAVCLRSTSGSYQTVGVSQIPAAPSGASQPYHTSSRPTQPNSAAHRLAYRQVHRVQGRDSAVAVGDCREQTGLHHSSTRMACRFKLFHSSSWLIGFSFS